MDDLIDMVIFKRKFQEIIDTDLHGTRYDISSDLKYLNIDMTTKFRRLDKKTKSRQESYKHMGNILNFTTLVKLSFRRKGVKNMMKMIVRLRGLRRIMSGSLT